MSDILIYVQHLLGIGHVRRVALINAELDRLGMTTTVVTGGIPDASLDFGSDNVIQLPPCRTADSGFSGLIDEVGNPVDEAWKQQRKQALFDAFNVVAPKLLMVEMFPFGRRAFRFELLPLLDKAGHAGIPRICSVRDLLVRKSDRSKEAWMRDIARSHFDRVLVHGDPALFDFGRSFPFADDIADLIEYTGYVAPKADFAAGERKGVLVSAGGGAVGTALIEAAIAARPLSSRFAGQPWDIVAGPHFPREAFQRLEENLPTGINLHRFLPDFRERMAHACVSVSQAGYNTLMDVLATETASVMVPFADGGESEQAERAAILAGKNVLSLLDPDDLNPQSLANQIDRAKNPVKLDISLDGAGITAAKLAERIRGKA
ncbi:glycosyl transferase [Thalassospira lucentensis]|uniref:Glycosyl transferase n=1 Tax=Thalassospira lucentensis TaxID=168935 RepID=A0A154LA50_9PROT|nr:MULTISPECIES: glycosyltransferase [Thalassospira]KZB68238.1 glycosyl transferase [Thalassospira lucentensis]MCH2274395.1 glycosyl transferase [Thalassospira sp.]